MDLELGEGRGCPSCGGRREGWRCTVLPRYVVVCQLSGPSLPREKTNGRPWYSSGLHPHRKIHGRRRVHQCSAGGQKAQAGCNYFRPIPESMRRRCPSQATPSKKRKANVLPVVHIEPQAVSMRSGRASVLASVGNPA